MKRVLIIALLAIGCSSTPDKKSSNNTTNTTGTNGTVGTTNNTVGTTNNVTSNTTNTTNNMPLLDTNELDLLFVIDNSGSMCQEQATLRNNARLLLGKLEEAGVDFQIGITTTDMNADYALEPVAAPGTLQATPQPVPGFDRSCHTATNDAGQPVAGDYKPIRDVIEAAVDCMTTPDDRYRNLSNADIECALYGTPQGCSIARAGCGGGSPCSAEDLFPSPSSYRQVPTVLRSADYASLAELEADFACASLVGTRGYGIEKGLAAAVLAVDPSMTGGPVGTPVDESAPNHGLLRQGAKFGVIFITDENDCSHDGSLREDSACGGDVCEFANAVGAASSPLLDPADLQAELMQNLRDSKGLPDLTELDVFAASIHGSSRRFDGDIPTDAQCGGASYEGIMPTCASSLGRAFSGDRYDRFLRGFPGSQIFPRPSGDTALTGWMCTGDFRPAIEAIGDAAVTALGL